MKKKISVDKETETERKNVDDKGGKKNKVPEHLKKKKFTKKHSVHTNYVENCICVENWEWLQTLENCAFITACLLFGTWANATKYKIITNYQYTCLFPLTNHFTLNGFNTCTMYDVRIYICRAQNKNGIWKSWAIKRVSAIFGVK